MNRWFDFRAVWMAIFLIVPGFVWSHPLPDIPVRNHYSAAGELQEIRVEVDPRAFEDDPEAFEYLLQDHVVEIPEEKLGELHAQAERFVEQRLAFSFPPIENVKPEFEWSWQKLGDEGYLALKDDPAVLVGSWKPKVDKDMTGFQVKSLDLDPFKMGMPLNVQFINFIDGVKNERYAVLFPGESSFVYPFPEKKFSLPVFLYIPIFIIVVLLALLSLKRRSPGEK